MRSEDNSIVLRIVNVDYMYQICSLDIFFTSKIGGGGFIFYIIQFIRIFTNM